MKNEIMLFDNKTPKDSVFGCSTGRDVSNGQADGSLSVNDVVCVQKYIIKKHGESQIQMTHQILDENNKRYIFDVIFTVCKPEPKWRYYARNVLIHKYEEEK